MNRYTYAERKRRGYLRKTNPLLDKGHLHLGGKKGRKTQHKEAHEFDKEDNEIIMAIIKYREKNPGYVVITDIIQIMRGLGWSKRIEAKQKYIRDVSEEMLNNDSALQDLRP